MSSLCNAPHSTLDVRGSKTVAQQTLEAMGMPSTLVAFGLPTHPSRDRIRLVVKANNFFFVSGQSNIGPSRKNVSKKRCERFKDFLHQTQQHSTIRLFLPSSFCSHRRSNDLLGLQLLLANCGIASQYLKIGV